MPWEPLQTRHHLNAPDAARLRISCRDGTVQVLVSGALAGQLDWHAGDRIAIQRGTAEHAGLWRVFKPDTSYTDSRWRLQYSGKSSRSLKLVLHPAGELPERQPAFDCAVRRDGPVAVIINIPWLAVDSVRRGARDENLHVAGVRPTEAAPKAAEREPQPEPERRPVITHPPARASGSAGDAKAGQHAPSAPRPPGPEEQSRAGLPPRGAEEGVRSPAPKLYRPSDTIQRPTRERLMAGR